MKTISIGGISLFLALPLFAMDIQRLENSIDNKEQWPTILSLLSNQNLIPNKFAINETNYPNPTEYSALHNLYPENTFCFDIDNTEYATFEKDDYGPSCELVVCPKNKQPTIHFPGPSKPEKKVLHAGSHSRITSFALRKQDSTKEIAVGREDGTITLFDITTDLYYERNCSLLPICSVTFHDDGLIIGTDEANTVHILNQKTHILLSISNEGTALQCPSLQPEQIVVVQEHLLQLSPEIPSQFFNHKFTTEQYKLLLQFACLKDFIEDKKVIDNSLFGELKNTLEQSDFELPVKAALETRLRWAMKASKPKNVLTNIKNGAVQCFKILHQCYTELTQPVTTESSTGDIV